MRERVVYSIACVSLVIGAAGGYMIADLQHEAVMFTNYRENYTDGGSICIETASIIRDGAQQETRAYLESKGR